MDLSKILKKIFFRRSASPPAESPPVSAGKETTESGTMPKEPTTVPTATSTVTKEAKVEMPIDVPTVVTPAEPSSSKVEVEFEKKPTEQEVEKQENVKDKTEVVLPSLLDEPISLIACKHDLLPFYQPSLEKKSVISVMMEEKRPPEQQVPVEEPSKVEKTTEQFPQKPQKAEVEKLVEKEEQSVQQISSVPELPKEQVEEQAVPEEGLPSLQEPEEKLPSPQADIQVSEQKSGRMKKVEEEEQEVEPQLDTSATEEKSGLMATTGKQTLTETENQ